MESGNALLDYVKQLKKSFDTSSNNPQTHELIKTAEAILVVFKNNQKYDRIVIPLLKVVSHLLSHDCFRSLQPDQHPFSLELVKLVKNEIQSTKDIMKLMASNYVFCWCLLFEQPVRNAAYQELLLLLANRYPKLRKVTASELYVRIMTDEFIAPKDSVENLLNILSETKWDAEDLDAIGTQVEKIYEFLNIDKPTAQIKVLPPTANKNDDMGYDDLVREAGY